MAPRALKRTGIVAGVAAGAVGIAYATERALVARLRHREDPDAGLPLVTEFDAMRVLDSHDGGTIYTMASGQRMTFEPGPVWVMFAGRWP